MEISDDHRHNPWYRLLMSDSRLFDKAGILLIAHRGGVVEPDSPQNSEAAIRRAAAAGFRMAEIDLRETSDGVPVLYHDPWMDPERRSAVSALAAREILSRKHQGTDEPILPFEKVAPICSECGLGLMLDIKSRPGFPFSEGFYDAVRGILESVDLPLPTLTLAGDDAAKRYLTDTVVFPLSAEERAAVSAGTSVDIVNRYWFGLPRDLLEADADRMLEIGILVVPAINTFRYPRDSHLEAAAKDVRRLIGWGVRAFQIDSVYRPLFP